MPDKWDQVKELFASALERDPEERSDFLRQACGADDSLRAEIESLLSSFDDAPTFLEDCPAADLSSAQSSAIAGRRIGAYRIPPSDRLGGMGGVYWPSADDQYRKRVAIEVLMPAIVKDEILRVFATSDRPWQLSTTPASYGSSTAGAPKRARLISSWSTSRVFVSTNIATLTDCPLPNVCSCSVPSASQCNMPTRRRHPS